MGRKTAKKYVLSKRTRYFDTGPERFVAPILPEVWRGAIWKNIMVPAGEWTFQADFVLTEGKNRIIVEVDGPYHRTARQERKTKWRDIALTEQKYRVIHIDSGLCVPKWRSYLRDSLKVAIKSENPVEHLFG